MFFCTWRCRLRIRAWGTVYRKLGAQNWSPCSCPAAHYSVTGVTEISVKLHWHLLKSLGKVFPGQKSLQSVSINVIEVDKKCLRLRSHSKLGHLPFISWKFRLSCWVLDPWPAIEISASEILTKLTNLSYLLLARQWLLSTRLLSHPCAPKVELSWKILGLEAGRRMTSMCPSCSRRNASSLYSHWCL